MEGGMLLGAACVLGFASAAPAGAAAFKGVYRAYTSAQIQLSLAQDARQAAGMRALVREMFAYVLRNGIDITSGMARRLLRISRVAWICENAVRLVQRKGFVASAQSIASVSCFALIALACVCAMMTQSFLAGVLVPLCAVLVLTSYCSHEHERELDTLRDQVPDALRCMEACLHAGLSLPQAFSEVASEISSPAKELFARVSHDLEMGYAMDEALARFRKLSGLPELGFVAMALDVQYACGGSATPILRSAEDSITKGLELRRALRVQTAQARLSAQVVSIMPFFLMAVLSLISPGFLDPFFASVQGMALLALAVLMQVAGVLMVRRLLALEL